MGGIGVTTHLVTSQRIMGSQKTGGEWGLEIPEPCENHIQSPVFWRVPADS